jgi:hypothetical protein
MWALTLAWPATGVRAQPSVTSVRTGPTITLTLKDAAAEEAVQVLGRALGVSITVKSAEGSLPHVTLKLEDATPLEALDRFAGMLNGRWQPVYVVRPAAPTQVQQPAPFSTGRRVTLNLENVAARVALSTVAAADRGVLEVPAATEPHISLKLDDVPVEEGMDRVAGALGMTWTRAFQIVPASVRSVSAVRVDTTGSGSASPSANNLPVSPAPSEKLFTLTEPPRSPAPTPERASPAKSPDLARALSDGMARLMQVDPGRRGSAIRQFAKQVERGLHDLELLPVQEQSLQRTRLTRVYQSGMRMFRGLTPDQQQEFRPLFDALRHWLKL